MHTDDRFTPETWEKFRVKWERQEITLEQLNGQMFVWMEHMYKMLVGCQREQDGMSHSLADLDARLQGVEERMTR